MASLHNLAIPTDAFQADASNSAKCQDEPKTSVNINVGSCSRDTACV